MPQEKPDTTARFQPALRSGPDLSRPALDIIRLDGLLDASILSPSLQALMLQAARVRNIVSSMRIEGERIDLERAQAAIDRNDANDRTERQVLQLSRAYTRIAAGHHVPLTLPGLQKLHEDVFTGVFEPEIVGVLKTRQNALVDAHTRRLAFLPTPPGRTPAELNSLFDWVARVQYDLSPPVLAAVFFAEFQGIHPFADGNGRIGRLLNLSLLRQLGLHNAPLVPFDAAFFDSGSKYYGMLAKTNGGRNWDLWTRFYLTQGLRAYRAARSRTDLRPVVEAVSGRLARSILVWALAGPGDWFAHGQVPGTAEFSVQGVTQALRTLTQRGVLEARGQRRGRRYRVSGIYLERVLSRNPVSQ